MPGQLFISYSHRDEGWLARLHQHLAQLKREGAYESWYDREIHAGGRIDREIEEALLNSSVFIACASPDYIASNYCFELELSSALEREKSGDLIIVPLILEPCDWLATPLKTFKAVPTDGKPISLFTNANVAFLEVVDELRRLSSSRDGLKREAPNLSLPANVSRYRVRKDFDQLDKRDFVEASFREIYDFFSASISELSGIPQIEGRLSGFTPEHFACTVINRGVSRGFETLHVRTGGRWGEIDILFGEQDARNTSNGGFSVGADEYRLHFNSMMGFSSREIALSARDVAQMLWDQLLNKVGISYA